MSDSSPPTTRVMEVLELVGARGADVLRSADLARELGIAKATTHAIVQTLCDRGWLVRSPLGRKLSLGPGIAPLARAVVEQRGLSSRALDAARGLAITTGYTSSVVELEGDVMYVSSVDPTGPRGHVLADRVAYAAPFGSLFAAWGTAGERAEWLRRGLVTGPAAAAYQAYLEKARTDGVLVERMSPVVEHVAPLLRAIETGSVSDDLRSLVRTLHDEVVRVGLDRRPSAAPQPVTSVAAPVHSEDGRVATALVVHPFTTIGSRDLQRAKALVVRAAEAVTESRRDG